MAHSPYSRVVPTRHNNWVWNRPNGERVPLRNFSEHQLRAVTPALHSVDTHLRPDYKLNASIKVNRSHLGTAFDKVTKGRTGALTYKATDNLAKTRIRISPKAFNERSPFHPAGLMAHEIGHAVGPHVESTGMRKDFEKSFHYQPRLLSSRKKVDGWKKKRNFDLKSIRNRQVVNAHEDFAETFRSTLGHPLASHRATPKQSNYMAAHVTPARHAHLMRYYFH